MLKHVIGVCFEFTWVGNLDQDCEHGSHVAASAQLVGLDTDAQLASTPLHVVVWTS